MDCESTPTIETERLILRRFTDDDVEALSRILADEETNRFLPWYPASNVEDARRFYEERSASCYALPRSYAYAICLKSDDVPIGYLQVGAEAPHDFGYGLRSDSWHRGLATEAGRAVLRRAREGGLPYVTATHDVRNPRSGEVMRKLGMTYRYSYEELWQPKGELVTFRMYQLNFGGDDGFTYTGYWDKSEHHFVEEL